MYHSFRPGKYWYDTDGNLIQAHGGSILYAEGKYYWYGENKLGVTGNATGERSKIWHQGVQLYSSDDLYNWENEGCIALETEDKESPFYQGRIMDRPHIIYNELTKKYVMWAKIGGLIEEGFIDCYFAVCESESITGEYKLVSKVTEIMAGDFDLVKSDGKAYIIFELPHTEMICAELNEFYTNITENISSHIPKEGPPFTREAPAFFEHNGKRFLLTSGTTGYFPNRSIVYGFSDFHGEWEEIGDPCVGDVYGNSFHAQFSSVFKHPFVEDLYIALGDRWLTDLSYTMPSADDMFEAMFNPGKKMDVVPCLGKYTDENTSMARYVWLPIRFSKDGKPYIEWEDEWKIEEFTTHMNSYDLDTYTLPYWEGNTVYHESVMVRKEKDGTVSEIPLLYPADVILSVRSSDLKTVYERGKDWELQNGKLVILTDSDVPFMTYEEYYPSVASENSFAAVQGGNIYFSEGSVLHKKQLAVTYKHSASWEGFLPSAKGHLMPKTMDKLKNNEELKILFYGDSITTGVNSSSAVEAAPYAETWMDMVAKSLKKIYRNSKITAINTAVGGKTSEWGVKNAQERVASYNPDFLVVGFGMNDGGFAPEQHRDNIKSIIDVAKEANPNVEVLIVSTMLPNPEVQMTVGNQPYFESELLTLETEGIAVAQITSMHKYFVKNKRYSDMTGNNVNHPNDFVARLYAQSVIATIK